jgi:hypothetical protein
MAGLPPQMHAIGHRASSAATSNENKQDLAPQKDRNSYWHLSGVVMIRGSDAIGCR